MGCFGSGVGRSIPFLILTPAMCILTGRQAGRGGARPGGFSWVGPMRQVSKSSRPRRWRLSAVGTGLALALLVACTGTPERTPSPRVSILDIEPLDLNLFEQRYVVTLRIQNTHDDALHVTGMSYVIRLNDEEFASGTSDGPFTVPAYGDRLVQILVVSDPVRLLEQFRTLARQANPSLHYGIEGGIRLEGAPGELPYRYDDELSFPRRDGRHKSNAI